MKTRPAVYIAINLQDSAQPDRDQVRDVIGDIKRARAKGMEVWGVLTAPEGVNGEGLAVTNPRVIESLSRSMGSRIPAKYIDALLVKCADNTFDEEAHEVHADFLRERDPWLVGVASVGKDSAFATLFGASKTLSQRSRVRGLTDRIDSPMSYDQLCTLRDTLPDTRLTHAEAFFDEANDASHVPPPIRVIEFAAPVAAGRRQAPHA